MQTLSGRRSNGLSPHSRRIATFAILLFALSGLISGFAVGAFVHPKSGGTPNNNGTGITPVMQQTKTATASPTPVPVAFNFPGVSVDQGVQKADGTTTYTLHAYLTGVVDKNGQPIHASGLTCKLWLVQRLNGKLNISSDILKNINDIQNPIPGTIKNQSAPVQEIQGLTFDAATQQVQACTTYDQVSWQYTISTSVEPGPYDLVVLFDWQGKHYNWSWENIDIKKANSN
ncbi:MAG TPA: hypothetical protein VNE38_04380 [Ktedonobacteraceae bacterium]|nr:hypothetical protein [Ktedonobacteraceae bacterium]